MSILDTFLILFESDASSLDDGMKHSDKAAKDLNKTIDGVDKNAMKLGGSFVKMASQAAAALAAGLSVGAMLSATFAAADVADRLNDLSSALDLSTKELDAWGAAVQMSGGTAEGFQGSLTGLTAAMAQVEATGKSRLSPYFAEMGIDLEAATKSGKTALDMLLPIADQMEGMSKGKALGLGQKMGLDQGTIMLLQSGRREVEAMIKRQKELGTITAKDAKVAGDFNDALDETQRAFRSVFTAVGTSILPAFQWVLEKMQALAKWSKENKDFIIGIMIGLAAVVAGLVVPAFWSMAAAVLAATWPFLLIGAAIAAAIALFALIYDDIMNFIDGNDSLIGSLVDVYNKFMEGPGLIQDIVRLIIAAFQWMADKVGAFFGSMVDGAMAQLQLIVDFVKSVMKIVGGVADFVGGFLSKLNVSLGSGATGTGLAEGKSAMAVASSNPMASVTSNAISNGANNSSRSNKVNIGKVDVNTQATDANGISKAIGNSLSDQMRQAVNGFDDGVAA